MDFLHSKEGKDCGGCSSTSETFRQAAGRTMENIGCDKGNATNKGVKIGRRLLKEEKKNSSAN